MDAGDGGSGGNGVESGGGVSGSPGTGWLNSCIGGSPLLPPLPVGAADSAAVDAMGMWASLGMSGLCDPDDSGGGLGPALSLGSDGWVGSPLSPGRRESLGGGRGVGVVVGSSDGCGGDANSSGLGGGVDDHRAVLHAGNHDIARDDAVDDTNGALGVHYLLDTVSPLSVGDHNDTAAGAEVATAVDGDPYDAFAAFGVYGGPLLVNDGADCPSTSGVAGGVRAGGAEKEVAPVLGAPADAAAGISGTPAPQPSLLPLPPMPPFADVTIEGGGETDKRWKRRRGGSDCAERDGGHGASSGVGGEPHGTVGGSGHGNRGTSSGGGCGSGAGGASRHPAGDGGAVTAAAATTGTAADAKRSRREAGGDGSGDGAGWAGGSNSGFRGRAAAEIGAAVLQRWGALPAATVATEASVITPGGTAEPKESQGGRAEHVMAAVGAGRVPPKGARRVRPAGGVDGQDAALSGRTMEGPQRGRAVGGGRSPADAAAAAAAVTTTGGVAAAAKTPLTEREEASDEDEEDEEDDDDDDADYVIPPGGTSSTATPAVHRGGGGIGGRVGGRPPPSPIAIGRGAAATCGARLAPSLAVTGRDAGAPAVAAGSGKTGGGGGGGGSSSGGGGGSDKGFDVSSSRALADALMAHGVEAGRPGVPPRLYRFVLLLSDAGAGGGGSAPATPAAAAAAAAATGLAAPGSADAPPKVPPSDAVRGEGGDTGGGVSGGGGGVGAIRGPRAATRDGRRVSAGHGEGGGVDPAGGGGDGSCGGGGRDSSGGGGSGGSSGGRSGGGGVSTAATAATALHWELELAVQSSRGVWVTQRTEVAAGGGGSGGGGSGGGGSGGGTSSSGGGDGGRGGGGDDAGAAVDGGVDGMAAAAAAARAVATAASSGGGGRSGIGCGEDAAVDSGGAGGGGVGVGGGDSGSGAPLVPPPGAVPALPPSRMIEVPVDSAYETLHAFLAGDGVAAPAFAAESAASLYLADGSNALLAGPFTVPRGARRLAGGQIHLASFTVLPSGAVVAHVPEPPPAAELLSALRSRLAGVSKRQVLAAMAFPDLLPFFLLTRNELATALGVCVTLIKKIFRAHGIRHWPNRKLRNLKRRMDDRRRRLAAALAPPAARRRPSLAVARLHADLTGLEAEFRAVVEEATAGQASFLI